jgi:hypothetical protein
MAKIQKKTTNKTVNSKLRKNIFSIKNNKYGIATIEITKTIAVKIKTKSAIR